MCWVTFEDNLPVFVNKYDVWDALNFEILVSGATTVRSQVVFDVGPALICNVRSKLVEILVET